MFQALSRKRRSSDDAFPQSNKKQQDAAPLEGSVVCLTGFQEDEKTRLHRMVEELGGRFARNMDTSETTHLIANAPEGVKYETARTCKDIFVVTPLWLTESHAAGQRLLEEGYLVQHEVDDTPLLQSLNELLNLGDFNRLFYGCRFFCLGFDSDSEEYIKLERLVLRGRGVVFWDLNEIITHVIVKDGCHLSLIEASETISLHHPLGPPALSPRWLVQSYKGMRRLETNLPEYRPRKPAPKAAVVKAVDHSVVKKKTSTLFRGLVFALVRLSPIAGAVDFDAGQLTSDILSNGGQILSAKVLEALKADSKRQEAQRRTCYVIFWGGYSPTHMSIHTLLSQIQKDDLANLVSVTPIWLQTAITDGKLPSRTKPAVLFQPQSWPLRVLPSCLKIAISGFVQPERTAIIQLIQAVGASCTDSLKPHNTHLICRHPKGPKYEKAVEWKLHTVSIDWLYHVVRYGYGGEKGNEKSGCEAEFSIDDRSRKNSKSVPAQSSGEEEDVKQLVSSSQEVSETQF